MKKTFVYLFTIILILGSFIGCRNNNMSSEDVQLVSELNRITNEELLVLLDQTKELENQIINSYDKSVQTQVKFNYDQSLFEDTAYKAISPYETSQKRIDAYSEYYIDPPKISELSQSWEYAKDYNFKNKLIKVGADLYMIPDLSTLPTLNYIEVISRKIIKDTLKTEIKIKDKDREYNEIIYFILDNGNLKIDNRIKNEINSSLSDITDEEILEILKKSENVFLKTHSSFDVSDKISIENKNKDGQVETIDLYKTVSPYNTPENRQEAMGEFFIDSTYFNKEFNINTVNNQAESNTLYEDSGFYYFYPLQLGIRGTYNEIVSSELSGNKLKVIARAFIIDSYSYMEFVLTEENDKVKILESNKLPYYSLDYKAIKKVLPQKSDQIFNNIAGNYSMAFRDINEIDGISINNEKMPAASTIKIYVMIEAYNQVNIGKINLNDIIILNDSMKVQGSGKLQYDPNGTKVSIEQLISLMMIESDNTAANIMIDKLGVDNINSTIKKIGCNDTELNRKMMDTNSINKGIDNYTSVDDLSLTLSKLYNGQCINSIYDNKMIDIMKGHQLKSKIPNKLPKGTIVAHKSGEMSEIENDAAIVYTDKGAYILCLLTNNGISSEQVRGISDISKEVYDNYIEYKTK